jgi:hypothetical protein
MMQVDRVDPRDSRWEEQGSRYRVYFWTSQRESGMLAWRTDEYELTDRDLNVMDVLIWAAERANSVRVDKYEVYLVLPSNSSSLPDDAGLIKLGTFLPQAPGSETG